MRRRVIIVFAGAVAVVSAAIFVLVQQRPEPVPPSPLLTREQIAALRSSGDYDTDFFVPATSFRVSQVSGESLDPAGVLSQHDLALIADKASRLVAAYASADYEEFASLVDGVGTPPPAVPIPNADALRRQQWQHGRQVFAEASAEASGARLLLRTNGKAVARSPLTLSTLRVSRTPELDPVQNRLVSVEASVPFSAQVGESSSFDAKLGLVFVRDPSSNEWVHWQTTIYDKPVGLAIAVPPM